MSKNEPKSLSELLQQPGSRIGRLASIAKQKLALGQHIRDGLPSDLAAEMLHCSVDDNGTLVIRTSSPEWAARLRFENETLLKLSRELYPETTQVKIRVAHPDD